MAAGKQFAAAVGTTAALVAGLLVVFEEVAVAAGIVVTTTTDENNADGDCSLQEALAAAETDSAVDACTAGAGADVITFDPATNGVPIVASTTTGQTGALTITGNGPGTTTLAASISGSSADLTIRDLELAPGPAAPALSNNGGTLDAANVDITSASIGLTTNSGFGSFAETILDHVDFSGITTMAINNNSGFDTSVTNLAMTDITITDAPVGINNNAGFDSAITLLLATNITITGGDPVNNSSGFDESYAEASFRNATITGASGAVAARNSAASGSSAVLHFDDSTIAGSANDVIVNSFGWAFLERSTIIGGNGFGFSNHGDGVRAEVVNSTITGVGEYAVSVDGGAAAVVRSSTISGNTSAFALVDGSLEVRSSIVAGNTGLVCFGPITSGGHNTFDEASCPFTATGDQQVTDAGLEPLADNGGPTQTFLLADDSPAIDVGGTCSGEDQRGFHRPVDGDGNGSELCDAGSVEIGAAPVAPPAPPGPGQPGGPGAPAAPVPGRPSFTG